jgi:hypothetical protein
MIGDNMLKTVELSSDSIEYIRQELSLGGVLSNELLKMDLYTGSIFTYLPSEFIPQTSVDYAESLEFLTGKKVSDEFDKVVGQFILNYLGNAPKKMAIFETMWNGSDPIASKRPLQYFTIQGRKYDFLRGNDEKGMIMDYISDAHGYPTVIIAVDIGSEDLIIINKTDFADEMALWLANKTEKIIVGAFDGEGYLIWQKKS